MQYITLNNKALRVFYVESFFWFYFYESKFRLKVSHYFLFKDRGIAFKDDIKVKRSKEEVLPNRTPCSYQTKLLDSADKTYLTTLILHYTSSNADMHFVIFISFNKIFKPYMEFFSFACDIKCKNKIINENSCKYFTP